MDSPTVVLENSSGFLSVPPTLELFLSMLLLQHQILSPETLQLSYSLILVAFFSKNGSHCGICTTIKKKKPKETLQLSYSLIWVSFFLKKKWVPLWNIHNYKKTKKNMCGFSQRYIPLDMPKICLSGFSSGIH